MAKLEPFGWVFTPRIKELITIEVDKDPIVFCKDCKHRDPEDKKCDFSDVVFNLPRDDYFFCANGEVKWNA